MPELNYGFLKHKQCLTKELSQSSIKCKPHSKKFYTLRSVKFVPVFCTHDHSGHYSSNFNHFCTTCKIRYLNSLDLEYLAKRLSNYIDQCLS